MKLFILIFISFIGFCFAETNLINVEETLNELFEGVSFPIDKELADDFLREYELAK